MPTFKTTWVSTDKFNYADMNRIETNCKYLADQLISYGYEISITSKLDWAMADFPTMTHLDRIRSNVNTIIAAFSQIGGSPAMDWTTKFIWDDANDLETNMQKINTLLGLMISSFWYCGEIYGGER